MKQLRNTMHCFFCSIYCPVASVYVIYNWITLWYRVARLGLWYRVAEPRDNGEAPGQVTDSRGKRDAREIMCMRLLLLWM